MTRENQTMTQAAQTNVALNQMNYEQMQGMLNNVFSLLQKSGPTQEITLVEVEQISEKKPALHSWQKEQTIKEEPIQDNGKRTPFTLVFRFPKEHKAEQGIYHLSHPEAGAFEGTFFTPIAEDEDGIYFEAVFT